MRLRLRQQLRLRSLIVRRSRYIPAHTRRKISIECREGEPVQDRAAPQRRERQRVPIAARGVQGSCGQFPWGDPGDRQTRGSVGR